LIKEIEPHLLEFYSKKREKLSTIEKEYDVFEERYGEDLKKLRISDPYFEKISDDDINDAIVTVIQEPLDPAKHRIEKLKEKMDCHYRLTQEIETDFNMCKHEYAKFEVYLQKISLERTKSTIRKNKVRGKNE
jgi:uncharacterized protein YdcH (DUF465 family)